MFFNTSEPPINAFVKKKKNILTQHVSLEWCVLHQNDLNLHTFFEKIHEIPLEEQRPDIKMHFSDCVRRLCKLVTNTHLLFEHFICWIVILNFSKFSSRMHEGSGEFQSMR